MVVLGAMILLLVLAVVSWKWAAITAPFMIYYLIKEWRKNDEEVVVKVNANGNGSLNGATSTNGNGNGNGAGHQRKRRRRGPRGRRARIKIYKMPSK